MDLNFRINKAFEWDLDGGKKKKRGEIEKQRRDRINYCLNELKSLIPNAVEKETTTKLEKAEILDLAVEYLRKSNEARFSSHHHKRKKTRTPQDPRVDYRQMGYRDCISDISRHLVEIEGFDPQDQSRLRLISYLQCFNHETPP